MYKNLSDKPIAEVQRAQADRWEEEKLDLADSSTDTYKFFIRTSDDESTIESVFKDAGYVNAGVSGEIGVVTEEMTQGEFDEAIKKLSDVRSVIRLV